jgi:predicted nucleotide-binding protein
MDKNDATIRALSSIKGLKTNLPDYHSVEAHWVEEYNSAIEKIEKASNLNLEEYKVPANMLDREPVSGNSLTGEIEYSTEIFCERSVLLRKLDSALDYLNQSSLFATKPPDIVKPNFETSEKVFIVHGHNDAVKESVARFIEKLELKAVILHEQPNKGRTIIEKFIDYSDVGFALVLLTADDVGAKKIESNMKLTPRARQNVIFELGYFIGRIGRERVCAIYEEGVEIPSDYRGVVFEPLDSKGNWKFAIAKELREAGYDIDLNKIL